MMVGMIGGEGDLAPFEVYCKLLSVLFMLISNVVFPIPTFC